MAEKANCKAKDCSKETFAKGYCRKHYRLWKAGEMPKPRYKICTAEKCRKPRVHGSLCEEHYKVSIGKAEPPPAASPAAAPAQETSA